MKLKQIQQLQMYVKNKSVDELKSTRPLILMRDLKMDRTELSIALEFLYTKGAMSYKYNISCSNCKVNHTIYQNEIRRKIKECDECGETIVFEKELERAELLCVIDKDEVNLLTEDIDLKEVALNKVVEIEEVKALKGLAQIKQTKEEKMEIFIGSSTQAKGEIEKIALVIEEQGFEALPWNSSGKGVFRAGNFTLENLINTAERVKAAIFIFNADDETWYSSNGVKVATTRDNVLFEYGLFVGKKGRKNVAIVCKNQPKIASDLNGITFIDASKEFHMKAQLRDWLENLE